MKETNKIVDKFEAYTKERGDCTLDEFAAWLAGDPEYGRQYSRQYIHQQLANTSKGRTILAQRSSRKRTAIIVGDSTDDIDVCTRWLDKLTITRRKVEPVLPEAGDILVIRSDKVTVTLDMLVRWETVYWIGKDREVLEVKVKKTPGL